MEDQTQISNTEVHDQKKEQDISLSFSSEKMSKKIVRMFNNILLLRRLLKRKE